MCVLPELTTDDLSMHIHHTLVKSFCWEHEIKLLMVSFIYHLTLYIYLNSSLLLVYLATNYNDFSASCIFVIFYLIKQVLICFILFLQVKNEQCLLDLAKGCPEHANATEKSVSCLMIEYPLDGNSEADTFVIGYHDTIMYSDIFPKPVIQLPE